jgi:hypothetical protein
MRRPLTLSEVAALTVSKRKSFAFDVDEFLDVVYLDHMDTHAADAHRRGAGHHRRYFQDARPGAVGEHLARCWGLSFPAWTHGRDHFGLAEPKFVPRTAVLGAFVLEQSPHLFGSATSS